METKSQREGDVRKLYVVIDGRRLLYCSTSRAKARAYHSGWNSATALVLGVSSVWGECTRRDLSDLLRGAAASR